MGGEDSKKSMAREEGHPSRPAYKTLHAASRSHTHTRILLCARSGGRKKKHIRAGMSVAKAKQELMQNKNEAQCAPVKAFVVPVLLHHHLCTQTI